MNDEDAATKPTLETILERINDLRSDMSQRFTAVEQKLEQIDVRLDRMEGVTYTTRADFTEMRADFREMRRHFRETLPEKLEPLTTPKG